MNNSTCHQCGGELSGKSTKFCSVKCGQRAHKQRLHADSLAHGAELAATMAPCPICGEMFTMATIRKCGGYAKRTMCSQKCRAVKKRDADRDREALRRSTPAGRAYYEAYRDAGNFARNSRKMRLNRRVLVSSPCTYCQVLFDHPASVIRRTCGSAECRKLHDRDRTNRRLALKVGATIERFTHQEIFERDGWICQLCKVEIPLDAEPRSPLSASLDHNIPLSRGGAHSRANCQLAHLVCNMRKSNTLPILA